MTDFIRLIGILNGFLCSVFVHKHSSAADGVRPRSAECEECNRLSCLYSRLDARLKHNYSIGLQPWRKPGTRHAILSTLHLQAHGSNDPERPPMKRCKGKVKLTRAVRHSRNVEISAFTLPVNDQEERVN